MDQAKLMELVANNLASLGVDYFVTGSQATIVYGEPRFTNVIDVVIDLAESHAEDFCAIWPDSEFYLNHETVIAEIKRRGMFNLIHPRSGLKVDFALTKDVDHDRVRLERRRAIQIARDVAVQFAAPEDVILKKLQWYEMDESDRHLRDIGGVVKIQGSKLDVEYIEQWATKMNVLPIWKTIDDRLSQ